ncbi:MAG: EamA family transporter [Oscillospiraceae bacterium]|nr:EamA family transporter [Oscillospiraceae bacterium]
MWLLLAFASALFAGLTSILAKIGIKDTNSDLATALRTVVVAVFAWFMTFVAGSYADIASVSPISLLFLILSGLSTGASWLCYFRALRLGDVSKVVPIDKSSTILTMLLAFIFLGEGLTWQKAAAMLIIAAGTYLMTVHRGTAQKEKSRAWLFYAALSALFAALTAILGKIGIQDVEANLGTAVRTLVVLAMAWAIVLAGGKHRGLPQISRRSWLFLGLSGLATGGSWLCFYRALQTGPASVVVPIDKLSIVITVAFGYFVFGEKLGRRAAAGLAMITVGTLSLLWM